MNKELAQLMLNTAANLLGFCLIVITSLHINNFTEGHFVDELTMVVTVMLTVSSVLSFVLLQREGGSGKRMFRWAASFFMAGLMGILVAIVLIAFNYI